MITVPSLILSARTKLGDVDIKGYRYTDMEIIDAINDALAVLSENLLCFARIWMIECKESVTRYELPHDFLRPIFLKYNNKKVNNIKSMESRVEEDSDTFFGASYDLQTLHLFNVDIKSSDMIELYYNYFESVSNKDENINLPNSAKEVIVSYMLHLLYQNPIRKDGAGRSTYYYNLYEKKMIALHNRLRMNVQSNNIRTQFKKV